jgi:glutamate-1-semialdehyde 2,1-aminomutase
VLPDLTTLGKYLAGGMTFGAFGGRADVMAAFDPARGGTLTHGGTFNNNVVSMAGAAAAMSEMLSEAKLSQLFARGESLRSRLNELFAASTLPLSATGVGSMMAVHTVDGPINGPHDLDTSDHELRQLLFHELLHRGCYIAARGFIALSLDITDEQCDTLVGAMSEAIDSISTSN